MKMFKTESEATSYSKELVKAFSNKNINIFSENNTINSADKLKNIRDSEWTDLMDSLTGEPREELLNLYLGVNYKAKLGFNSYSNLYESLNSAWEVLVKIFTELGFEELENYFIIYFKKLNEFGNARKFEFSGKNGLADLSNFFVDNFYGNISKKLTSPSFNSLYIYNKNIDLSKLVGYADLEEELDLGYTSIEEVKNAVLKTFKDSGIHVNVDIELRDTDQLIPLFFTENSSLNKEDLYKSEIRELSLIKSLINSFKINLVGQRGSKADKDPINNLSRKEVSELEELGKKGIEKSLDKMDDRELSKLENSIKLYRRKIKNGK